MDYDKVKFSGDFSVNLKPGTSTEQVHGMGYEVDDKVVHITKGSLFLTDFGVVIMTKDRQPFGWGYDHVVSVVSNEGENLYD